MHTYGLYRLSFDRKQQNSVKQLSFKTAQTEIKIDEGHINNYRYANDTTLMVESKQELRGLLMKVKEESEKAGLKLNIQKMKIMESGPISSWQIEREKWKQ